MRYVNAAGLNRELLDSPRAIRDAVERTIVMPTRERNVGTTISVGVHPFQSELQSPVGNVRVAVVLTRGMNAMVIPRTTSRKTRRWDVFVVSCYEASNNP